MNNILTQIQAQLTQHVIELCPLISDLTQESSHNNTDKDKEIDKGTKKAIILLLTS